MYSIVTRKAETLEYLVGTELRRSTLTVFLSSETMGFHNTVSPPSLKVNHQR